jgi:hypothetical protein
VLLRVVSDSHAHVHEPGSLPHRSRARLGGGHSDRVNVMSSTRADSIGMCVAGACAVHCIATPLIAGILPVIGASLLDPRTEWLFLLSSLMVSSFAMASGCVRGRRPRRTVPDARLMEAADGLVSVTQRHTT